MPDTINFDLGAVRLLQGPKGDKGDPGSPGADGADGRGITSVTKTSFGAMDTYTLHFTDGTEYAFTVTNGSGESGTGGGPGVYWAAYGTATLAEVKAAIQAGMAVYCVQSGFVYGLYIVRENAVVFRDLAGIEVTVNASGWREDASGAFATEEAVNELELLITKTKELLEYRPVSIVHFAARNPVREKGSTVTSVTFDYTVDHNSANFVDVATVNGTEVPIGRLTGSFTLSGLNITQDTTFTLSCTDAGCYEIQATTVTATCPLTFANRIYWGALADVYGDLGDTLEDLSYIVSDEAARSLTVETQEDQYVWYAAPARLGELDFRVNGMSGGFMKAGTVTVTNGAGYAELYNVYRSDWPLVGTFEVEVFSA